jgi:hypothetical protein
MLHKKHSLNMIHQALAACHSLRIHSLRLDSLHNSMGRDPELAMWFLLIQVLPINQQVVQLMTFRQESMPSKTQVVTIFCE